VTVVHGSQLIALEEEKGKLARELAQLQLEQDAAALGIGENPYVNNYDIIVNPNKESSGGQSSGPSSRATLVASQRVQHQRINPNLIIKENDVEIDRVVGKWYGRVTMVGVWARCMT